MKTILFRFSLILLTMAYVSCSETEKRDAKKVIDRVSHSGDLKGYQSVYIVDFENQTYRVDDNPNEELLQYPIYKNDDGSYIIVYDDEDYMLEKLSEPIDMFGTGISLLRYRFCDNEHFIMDIPTSY